MSTGAAIGLVCVILAAAIVYLLAISWADDGPASDYTCHHSPPLTPRTARGAQTLTRLPPPIRGPRNGHQSPHVRDTCRKESRKS